MLINVHVFENLELITDVTHLLSPRENEGI